MTQWEEYKFKIEAYTPDTLPMSRLAEYLGELAAMLGEFSHVHFARIEPGSSVPVVKVDIEEVPKVKRRIVAVKQGEGTPREMSAYRKINTMLREDNGSGTLFEGSGAKIIDFPGKKDTQMKLASIKQSGKIDGFVSWIGGSKDKSHITLEIEGKELSCFNATRSLAKNLAKYIFEYVRLYGEGRWERNEIGDWNLKSFRVNNFDVLPENTLTKTILELRALKGEWGENALNELLDDRHSDEGNK